MCVLRCVMWAVSSETIVSVYLIYSASHFSWSWTRIPLHFSDVYNNVYTIWGIDRLHFIIATGDQTILSGD